MGLGIRFTPLIWLVRDIEYNLAGVLSLPLGNRRAFSILRSRQGLFQKTISVYTAGSLSSSSFRIFLIIPRGERSYLLCGGFQKCFPYYFIFCEFLKRERGCVLSERRWSTERETVRGNVKGAFHVRRKMLKG